MAALSVEEQYDRVEEFAVLLAAAELLAANDWEVTFTDDIRAGFKRHGPRTHLSPAQRQTLERIANN
ncbi:MULTISPECIES: hypothetical protein [Pseudomonas]|uniref:Uncharacterized protein n=2 Tax=Pseudomonas TaxID=286 RepID=A0A0P9ZVE7_PSESX|nr:MULTISPECIES: hypothetical protein [Pseudomonas]KPY52813.1 Uncharacterized protein ALO46_00061 [Pseudomonas syringae pv. solidagae]MCA5970209.1 hypothetical protein [Pseudomonas sp. P135]RMT29895.1 hypothetical protein ALP49_00528 [Pseudomonas syringae pv. solidagae]RMT48323.1 hypothetical protein ALP48_00143 [Pseudomonas syringae pv. solidagae]CZT29868.1 hypothetical protein PCPL58_3412 [Pseudomonas cerasi]